jgi:hypothetical protein
VILNVPSRQMSQIYGFHYITNVSKDLCTNFHEIKFYIIVHVLREQESITSTILIWEVQSKCCDQASSDKNHSKCKVVFRKIQGKAKIINNKTT